MRLDGLTLMAAGALVSAIGCVLLLGAWAQLRQSPAILWWAIAYFINAAGVAVLAAGFALLNPVLIAVGSALVPMAASTAWGGIRVFHKHPTRWPLFLVSAAVWLAAPLAAAPGGEAAASTATTLGLAALWYLAAAVELWRGRGEKLAARWPLIGIIVLHAAIFAGGVIDVALGNVAPDEVPRLGSWFSLIHFEQMIFLLGSAVFLVMMCRERREAEYIAAARVDSLTGLVNRGAFFYQAERTFRRSHEGNSPVSLIAFDLDHFKAVNDAHGHAAGDRTLRLFADTAAAMLRPGDVLGRIGGEEFAAILPGAGAEAAYVIAERIRHAFEAATRAPGGTAVHATVSAGVAMADAESSMDAMLEAADRALYRAKRLGRNRVVRVDSDAQAGGDSNVIRVA